MRRIGQQSIMTRSLQEPKFVEATEVIDSEAEVLLRYLDYFRETVITKLTGLDESQLRASILPSGWTPIQLLKHLRYVELRWFVWGFEGEPVDHPWGDQRKDSWFVDPQEPLVDLFGQLRAQGRRTRDIVESHDLDQIGLPSDRWEGAEPASLKRVLLHVFQEYARHAGHLDIVRELLDGTVGE